MPNSAGRFRGFAQLRVSYSIVRAVHFMRTTPLRQWQKQAETFDSMMRRAIERIMGFPMGESAFTQACLTPKLGGLGLRKTVEHADLAFQASWHESKKTSHEIWDPPPGMSDVYISQKEGSYKFDEQKHKDLVSQADVR